MSAARQLSAERVFMKLIDPPILNALQQSAGHEFVAELVGTFLEEAPLMLAELRAALAAADAPRFRRSAHSLKSNGLSFGALPLAEAARALELGGLPPDASALAALEQLYELSAVQLQEASRVR
jgi:HPt (histidine-containing phosphotransfer) domain-containing protein